MTYKRRLWSSLLVVCLVLIPLSVASARQERPTVALVLGGGAARGFSHIGLIQALEENGIPIDMIVGTSMGSIVAGLYAGGYSVENIAEVAVHLDASKLLDIPIPLTGGVVDSTGIQVFLDELLGGRTYDEMPIPFKSVMVDLGTARDVAFSEGKVSIGIQASMSIPGVFPPVEINGRYYVDGGLTNQVPANVAAAMGADVIIAVSLEKDYSNADYRNIIDNLRMSLAAMMGGYTQINTSMADVVIVPKVGLDSSWEFQKVAYFIEQGYEAGLEYMDQIKAAILAKEPGFTFHPYRQQGYTKDELKEIVGRAEQRVERLPKRFTFKPEFQFDRLYNFPKLGFKFTHGPLSWFGIGYRYGMDPEDGGHEVFVDWGKHNWGSVDLFVRKSPQKEQPTFGFYVQGPELKQLSLEAAYASQGEKAWQVSASNPRLWDHSPVVAGLSLRVTGLRQQEDVPLKDTLLMAAAPQVQVFPWGEEHFPVTVVLARPYVLGRLTLESPVTKLDVRPSLTVGIGSELHFFGLYPADLSLGVEVSSTAETRVNFRLTGLRF
ncbi:MAG TPA: patatin-like phospholipase family protein [Firmicutes bacterium]|nr:patatin-like phospholipase family protein [Bacillota bacterium]